MTASTHRRNEHIKNTASHKPLQDLFPVVQRRRPPGARVVQPLGKKRVDRVRGLVVRAVPRRRHLSEQHVGQQRKAGVMARKL